MPGMRAGGLWLQAMLVADRDAPAAIALYQQAIDADTGSLPLEESCRNFQLGLISRTDDVEAAIAGFTHVVNAWQTRTGSTWTTGAIQEVAFWLARLGYHDGAARLYGAGSWGFPPPEILALPEVMGESAYTAAVNAGAALDHRAVGELALELLAQVRRDQTGD